MLCERYSFWTKCLLFVLHESTSRASTRVLEQWGHWICARQNSNLHNSLVVLASYADRVEPWIERVLHTDVMFQDIIAEINWSRESALMHTECISSRNVQNGYYFRQREGVLINATLWTSKDDQPQYRRAKEDSKSFFDRKHSVFVTYRLARQSEQVNKAKENITPLANPSSLPG